ncbi:hypothetical protein T492DRAFT_891745, partial [Pavlovales sp. CCMP2436]
PVAVEEPAAEPEPVAVEEPAAEPEPAAEEPAAEFAPEPVAVEEPAAEEEPAEKPRLENAHASHAALAAALATLIDSELSRRDELRTTRERNEARDMQSALRRHLIRQARIPPTSSYEPFDSEPNVTLQLVATPDQLAQPREPTGPQIAPDLRAPDQPTGLQRAIAQRQARFDFEKRQPSVSPPGSIASTDERSQASTDPATTHNVNDHAAHYFAEKPFDNLLPGSDKHMVTLDRRMSAFETIVNSNMETMIAIISGGTEFTSRASGRRTEVTEPLIQAVMNAFDHVSSEAMLLSGINVSQHETGRFSSTCFFLERNNPMAGVTTKPNLPHFALKTITAFETLLCSFLDVPFVQSARLFEATAKQGLISALLHILHNKQKHSVQHSHAKQMQHSSENYFALQLSPDGQSHGTPKAQADKIIGLCRIVAATGVNLSNQALVAKIKHTLEHTGDYAKKYFETLIETHLRDFDCKIDDITPETLDGMLIQICDIPTDQFFMEKPRSSWVPPRREPSRGGTGAGAHPAAHDKPAAPDKPHDRKPFERKLTDRKPLDGKPAERKPFEHKLPPPDRKPGDRKPNARAPCDKCMNVHEVGRCLSTCHFCGGKHSTSECTEVTPLGKQKHYERNIERDKLWHSTRNRQTGGKQFLAETDAADAETHFTDMNSLPRLTPQTFASITHGLAQDSGIFDPDKSILATALSTSTQTRGPGTYSVLRDDATDALIIIEGDPLNPIQVIARETKAFATSKLTDLQLINDSQPSNLAIVDTGTNFGMYTQEDLFTQLYTLANPFKWSQGTGDSNCYVTHWGPTRFYVHNTVSGTTVLIE